MIENEHEIYTERESKASKDTSEFTIFDTNNSSYDAWKGLRIVRKGYFMQVCSTT